MKQETNQNQSTSGSIDYVEALKRPFKDTRKFLIGTLLGMVPLVNLVVIGYTLDSTGLKKEKGDRVGLPEWMNYGDLFMTGLKAVIIGIILGLPAAVVIFGTLGSVIFSPVLSMILGGVPYETWDSLASGTVTDLQMESWLAQNWTEFVPLFTNAVPFLIFGGLLAALAFYLMPAALLAWLNEDRMSAAFTWNVVETTMSWDYLVNWLIVGYLGGVLSSLLGWVPFLGTGITMYVSGVFSYTVFAILYERGKK
jgi:hypothetical protein